MFAATHVRRLSAIRAEYARQQARSPAETKPRRRREETRAPPFRHAMAWGRVPAPLRCLNVTISSGPGPLCWSSCLDALYLLSAPVDGAGVEHHL